MAAPRRVAGPVAAARHRLLGSRLRRGGAGRPGRPARRPDTRTRAGGLAVRYRPVLNGRALGQFHDFIKDHEEAYEAFMRRLLWLIDAPWDAWLVYPGGDEPPRNSRYTSASRGAAVPRGPPAGPRQSRRRERPAARAVPGS